MIDKLDMFIALAREEHFGRAAEACGVAQPTLSAAIRQLEGELGVTLVHRGSRYRGLTPEGARALDWARRIVGDVHSLRSEMQGAREGDAGELRIAAIPTSLTAVSRLTAAFARRRPGVRLTIWSRNSSEILTMLANVEIDAGITYLDNEPLGRVQATPLYAESYVLATAPDGPLAGRATVRWDELAHAPLALLSTDMQNRRIIDRRMGPAKAQIESNSMIVLASHVRSGGWVTILPDKAARLFAADGGLKLVPIEDPGARHMVGLVTLPRTGPAPLLEGLIREAREGDAFR